MDNNRVIETTTIFYNGQFWVALVDRIECDVVPQDGGCGRRTRRRSLALHTFGPEPTGPEIIDMYMTHPSASSLCSGGRRTQRRRRSTAHAAESSRTSRGATFGWIGTTS